MSQTTLVVEDHKDDRRILRDLLGAAGYEMKMIEAHDAEAALGAIATVDAGLILMDGYEVTHCIKADLALNSIPIIASLRQLLAKIREYLPADADGRVMTPRISIGMDAGRTMEARWLNRAF